MPTNKKQKKTKTKTNKNCKCQIGGNNETLNHIWWKNSPSDIAYMLNKSLKKNRYISKILLAFPENYYARNIGKIAQHYGYGINRDRRHRENLKIPLIL